jgi:maltose-binding protein MalE
MRTQAGEEERGLAMVVNFEDTFWGFTASGGNLVDSEGAFTFDAVAWQTWLNWLDSMRQFETVSFGTNREELRQQFIDGDVAYYIGTPQDYVALEVEMGVDSFAITTLPSGIGGEPRPALSLQAFFINNRKSLDEIAIGKDFAVFATNTTQQQILLDLTGMLPANVNFVVEETSAIRPWFEQIQTAVALPNLPEVDILRADGDRIINRLAQTQFSPAGAMQELGELFDITVNFDDTNNVLPINEED